MYDTPAGNRYVFLCANGCLRLPPPARTAGKWGSTLCGWVRSALRFYPLAVLGKQLGGALPELRRSHGAGICDPAFAVRPRQADQLACPTGMQPLVCHGMYALCRHPGVLWFAGFYGFMALAWRSRQWLLAFALFTLEDVLYVCYQDRCIFPRTIDRYGEYQKTTPFLIPTASSVKEALASFKQSERNKWP